ncbi:regulatory LuxR family protein [Asanoa ferruginea]|uniref:Regulatory LuxR family protein n=1 Tax=Asanoa ferruginea TaxID=53367 RepID=A0A3D9ZWF7_9ACTN|nr:regulatory LuxR family protein [Asanoa ferruginea]
MPLVGRRSERALLVETLVPSHGPRAVVVIGEAGVGKTRLIADAIRDARAAGVTVLEGNCLPLSESVPFLPVTEALRSLDPSALARCAPHVRSELVRLMPDWGTERDPVKQSRAEGGQHRGRLFAALRDLLTALAADGPYALVFEDLHWADATTRDFVSYLIAVDRDGVTPLVMSSRIEELDPTRLLGRWFAELTRQSGVKQLHLDRLSRPEVAEHIHGLVGAPAPSAFVDEVYARADGNAFFTEQLVAALHDGGALTPGATLPWNLAQLLLAQAKRVRDDGQQVLAALAVAGRGLDEQLLAAITGLSGRGLATALQELADAWLIDRPGMDGRYRLRHALVGEAVSGDMLAGDRRERHAATARALTVHGAADGAGEVAEHWAAAGQSNEELPWRVAAAAEATDVYAHREAATHWKRVIDLWPGVPTEARPAGIDLPTSYLNAVDALDRSGDTRRAGQLAEEALQTQGTTTDRRALILLYERVSHYREWEQDGSGLEPLEKAMAMLAGLPPGREHVGVLRSYADALWDANRADEARPFLEQALRVCAAGVPAVDEVEALRDLTYYVFDDGDVSDGMRLLYRAEAVAYRSSDSLATITIHVAHCDALLDLGRLEDAASIARAGLEVARRAGLEHHAHAQFLRSMVLRALAELGDWAEAEPVIDAMTQSAPTSGASYDYMARARLDILAGDLTSATERWTAIEAVTHRTNLDFGANVVDRCRIDLWSGRPREALRRIQQVPQPLDRASFRPHTAEVLSLAMRTCADLAELALARQDSRGTQTAHRAAQDVVMMREAMTRDPFAQHPYYVTGPAHGANWKAEITRLHHRSDPDAWAAAAAAWEGLRRPHRVGYARWRQAEALLATGKTAPARDCLRQAATAAHNYTPLLAEIRTLSRLAHVDLRDQPTTIRPEPAPYGLTPREIAVLRLVADGLTNTQIGNRLYISEKTASVHITNIMRKLAVKNRAQAAALAQRAGLLNLEQS